MVLITNKNTEKKKRGRPAKEGGKTTQPQTTQPRTSHSNRVYTHHDQHNYDERPAVTHSHVLNIYRTSHSLTNFATQLMLLYFSTAELTDETTNVTGRQPNGKPGQMNRLDDERIELIRSTVLGYVNGTVEEKMKTWLKCAKAMSKKCLK